MSADKVQMFAVICDAQCGRCIGWTDAPTLPFIILCERCMDHPGEIEKRLFPDGGDAA